MSKSKTLEEAYFHTGNSGITLSIDKIDWRDNVDPCYRLMVNHSAYGTYTEVSLPLGSIDMVDYLIEALGRTKNHMTAHGFVGEYALKYGAEPSVDAYITIKDGLNRMAILEQTDGETKTVAFEVLR